MYANVSEYEMRLPRGYVDLSVEEMEYDGGGLWSKISNLAVGGALVTAMNAIDRMT